jgi:hypothetical protein
MNSNKPLTVGTGRQSKGAQGLGEGKRADGEW